MKEADAVTHFSSRFAETVGTEYALPFWKARVALYCLLRAMGVGKGDEVIVPGYTCVMDVNPILYVGATPRYADIDPATYNVDAASVGSLVSNRTRVILAQHTYGIPAPLDALGEIARDSGAWLVEDCCLAVGSAYNGRPVGTFGDAAYWSFQWNKVFTTGLGGMATTSNSELARVLEELADSEASKPGKVSAQVLAAQRIVHTALVWPKTSALARALFRRLAEMGLAIGSSGPSEFRPEIPEAFFTTMSTGQAKAGLRKLERLQENLSHRREIAETYTSLLSERGWPSLKEQEGHDSVLVGYPVRVRDKQRVLRQAPGHLVEIGSWFESPLHPKETPLDAYGYKPGFCLNAERACDEVVMLPTHPRVTKKEAARVVDFVARTTEPAA